MKITVRNVKLAWRYRRPLWKYRGLICHRKEIAGVAAAAIVIVAGILATRALRA